MNFQRLLVDGSLLVFSVPVLADNVDYQTIAAASQKPMTFRARRWS